jgi:hypothetical protein
MRSLKIALALIAVSFAHFANGGQTVTLSESQIREMIRESADKDLENTRRQRDYTYVQRSEQRKLDSKGRVTSTESKTFEIMILAGEPVQKLIEKNDKPLSARGARSEEEKIRKLVEKYQKENEEARRKRLQKSEKEAEENREFVREIADAYRFQFRGMDQIGGRPVYVIDADPIPGYKARSKDAKMLRKFRFRTWVDVAERQWVKLDIECR